MANIKVNDLLELNPDGTELFNDSETFMNELSEESEQMEVIGGGAVNCLKPTCLQTGIIRIRTVPVVFNQ